MSKNRILGLHGRKGAKDCPDYSAEALKDGLGCGGIFIWVFYNYAHHLLVGKPVESGGEYHSLGFIEGLTEDHDHPFVAVYPFIDPYFKEEGRDKFLELAMDAVWRMRGGSFDFGIFSENEEFLKAYSPESAGSIFEKAKAEPGYMPPNAEQNIRNHLSADKGLLAGGLKAKNRDPVEAARNVGAKFVAVYGKEYNNEEIRQMSEMADTLGITVIVNIQADFSRAKDLVEWAWIIANDPKAAYECAFSDTES
jgi:hypothetical protein